MFFHSNPEVEKMLSREQTRGCLPSTTTRTHHHDDACFKQGMPHATMATLSSTQPIGQFQKNAAKCLLPPQNLETDILNSSDGLLFVSFLSILFLGYHCFSNLNPILMEVDEQECLRVALSSLLYGTAAGTRKAIHVSSEECF